MNIEDEAKTTVRCQNCQVKQKCDVLKTTTFGKLQIEEGSESARSYTIFASALASFIANTPESPAVKLESMSTEQIEDLLLEAPTIIASVTSVDRVIHKLKYADI